MTKSNLNKIDVNTIARTIVDAHSNSVNNDEDSYEALESFQNYFSVQLIEKLFSIAEEYYSVDPHKSLDVALICKVIAESLDDTFGLALASWACGIAYCEVGKNKASLEEFWKAEIILKETGPLIDYIGLKISKCGPLFACGKYLDVLEIEKEVTPLLESIEIYAPRYWGNLKSIIARVKKRIGNIDESISYYEDAINFYSRCSSVSLAQNAKINLAIVYEDHGDLKKAFNLYSEAEKIIRSEGEPVMVAKVDLNLGLYFWRVGQLQLSIAHLAKALIIYEELDFAFKVFNCRLFLGQVYLDLNLLPETINMMNSILENFDSNENVHDTVLTWIILGRAYKGVGDYEKSYHAFDQGIKIVKELEINVEYQHLGVERAELKLLNDKPEDCIDELQIEYFPQKKNYSLDDNIYARVQILLARSKLHEKVQDLVATEAHLNNALKVIPIIQEHEQLIQANTLLGKLHAIKGDKKKARKFIMSALEETMRVADGALLDDLRLQYLSKKTELLKLFVQLSYEKWLDDNDVQSLFEALNLIQRAPLKPQISQSQTDREEGYKLKNLKERWNWLNQAMNTTLIAKSRRSKVNYIEKEQLLAELRTIESQIKSRELNLRILNLKEDFNLSFGSNSPTLEEFQSKLESSEVVINIFVSGDSIHLIAISSEWIQMENKITTNKELLSFIRAWKFHISRFEDWDSRHQINFETSLFYLQNVYRMLIEPVYERICSFARLIFVVPPHLQELPLSASWNGRNYLIELFEISYLSSFESFGSQEPRNHPILINTLLIGNSVQGQLPSIHNELNNISCSLDGFNPTVLVEKNATVQNFEKYSLTSSLIHIASHITYRPDNPQFSNIFFYDKSMTVSEVSSMKLLNQPLIILSACESGRGTPLGGGLLGMARGFMSIGAGEMIVSQWKIEDQFTSSFFTYFYSQLIDKKSVSRSLQLAQIKFAQNTHPVFWAGFMHLTG